MAGGASPRPAPLRRVMTMRRTLPTVLLLAALVLLFAGPAAASLQAPPLPVERDVNVDDTDGDGWEETDGYVVGGGPCGCACPVVFAGVHMEAAGSEADVVAGTVILPFCGFGAWWDVDPADPDLMAPIVVDPALWCWFYGDPLGMDGDCIPDGLAIQT